MSRLARILLLTLAFVFLATASIDAKKRKSRKRHRVATPTEQVVSPPSETKDPPMDEKTSKWVNTRNGNTIAVMLNVWRDINLKRCLDDFHAVKPQIIDSLEAKKKPDETISFYQPTLYTLTRMMNYQKFHAEGYSPRLTIYFYTAAALFILMLIVWLVKFFFVSPLKQ